MKIQCYYFRYYHHAADEQHLSAAHSYSIREQTVQRANVVTVSKDIQFTFEFFSPLRLSINIIIETAFTSKGKAALPGGKTA